MSRAIGILVGVILLSHAVLGFFVHGVRLLGIFNADPALDILYLVSALAVFGAVAARGHGGIARALLVGVAVLLALTAIVAMITGDLLGLAPTGFTGPDFIVLFGLSGALLIAALLPRPGAPVHQYDRG